MAFDPRSTELVKGGGRPSRHKVLYPLPAPLDVIAVIVNPCRYKSRYDLYRAFEAHMIESGVRLHTVELAYGERPFEILGHSSLVDYTGLRTESELWHKENLINIGISRLPRDWKYVAWIDADIHFGRGSWAQETLHQLQHYAFVQPWSHAQDLGVNYEPLDRHASFAYCYRQHAQLPAADVKLRTASGLPYGPPPAPSGPVTPTFPATGVYNWHPGFAWAATRPAIDAVGGLIDWSILGASDHHMAKALVGRVREATPKDLTPQYYAGLDRWQALAEKSIRRNIGYVPGTIIHYWHGEKTKRRYWDRWQILYTNRYDPTHDIKRDWQGVYQLDDDGTSRAISLRDEIRAYFRERQEDAT